MKRTWVFDLETLNIFTATFIDKDSDEKRIFVIADYKDERKELFEFLDNEVAGLIGYNSLFFDSQIIEFLYRNPQATAKEIQKYAIIITSNNDRRPDVPEWKLRHKHLDLFRALSLSTKAKRVGLKWTEYMLDMDNIEDMPSQGDGDNWEEMVLSYNLNDVIATKKLYQKYYHEIELRKTMSKNERVHLLNSTEPDMAKKLFLRYLSQAMNVPENDLRVFGTNRTYVAIKDIIFPYVHFESELLQTVKKSFEQLVLAENDTFEFNVPFGGISTQYGLGGLHASVEKKIVESTDTHIIKSLDVVSFYPNLMIRNKLHPAHIPQEVFCNLYEGFFNQRRSIPKSDPKNYILKILLNATYGLTNDKFSFLRDRQITLSICINGQLLLSMLFEKLLTIPDSQLVMINTDGGEIKIPREYEQQYYDICKDWEKLTNLELEFVDYQKLVIENVNNYIGVYTNGKTKTKGRFEFENIPLHKNKSHNIIPIAVFNYFVHNKSIEETIYNHTNIFDFCAGVRARQSEKSGQSWYELHSIKGSDIFKEKLSKTVRYFISVKGKTLIKCYENGDWEHVEAPYKRDTKVLKDWKVTYFNKAYYIDMKDYDIDYSYYIYNAREIIQNIESKQQLSLF